MHACMGDGAGAEYNLEGRVGTHSAESSHYHPDAGSQRGAGARHMLLRQKQQQ